MTFVELIRSESEGERRKIIFTATAAGIANGALLFLVSTIAQAPEDVGLRMFLVFGLSFFLYIVCARHTYHRTTSIVESALHRIKMRIVGKIERAELEGLERLGTAEIYDRITENVTVISNAAGVVANLLQSLCILAFATLYLAWLSFTAFAVLALLLAIGMSVYISKEKQLSEYVRQMGQERLTFFDLLTDLLRGFKELKFSRARRREVREDIGKSSDVLRAVTVNANHLFDDNYILANSNLFVMLGALVFVLPQHMKIDGSTLTKLTTGVMFAWGPISALVSGFPAYVRSNIALAQIDALEKKLDAAAGNVAPGADEDDPWSGQLSSVRARDIEYEYTAGDSGERFHVGPVNLTVHPGEVVFIVGGNGSGKSTLLKVLTGLYTPTAGALYAADILVDGSNVAAYREMISSIYSDFHLFSKLYGLAGVDGGAVARLLKQMQLDGKTSFEGMRFTTRSLSTGQRKRLAMIVALLEDRPLYIFDEWAADQDPEFRRYFYEELIPMLKGRGKTVIAVSHDDRYFRCADRVITMEYGKIRSVEETAARVDPGAEEGGRGAGV